MSRKKKPPKPPHISEYCDVGMERCGAKLTDENRHSLDGFQVCDTCYKVAKQRNTK